MTSKFSSLLIQHCPLPSEYQELKARVFNFLKDKETRKEDGTKLFDDLYRAASPYSSVIDLMQDCLKRAIPR